MNQDKTKRMKEKMDAFVADLACDMLEPETIVYAENSIKDIFKKSEIPYTRGSLKAFYEGCGMMAAAAQQGDPMLVMSLLMSVRKIIQDLEVKVSNLSKENEKA